AAARGQQRIEDVIVVVGEVAGDVEVEFDRAAAEFLQYTRVRHQFIQTGQTGGQRAPLVADMVGRLAGRPSHRAGGDGVVKQALDLHYLFGARGALHRFLAHYVMAKGRERGQKADVDSQLVMGRRVDVLGEGLPLPIDSLFQHIEGDSFNIDQVPGRDL